MRKRTVRELFFDIISLYIFFVKGTVNSLLEGCQCSDSLRMMRKIPGTRSQKPGDE